MPTPIDFEFVPNGAETPADMHVDSMETLAEFYATIRFSVEPVARAQMERLISVDDYAAAKAFLEELIDAGF